MWYYIFNHSVSLRPRNILDFALPGCFRNRIIRRSSQNVSSGQIPVYQRHSSNLFIILVGFCYDIISYPCISGELASCTCSSVRSSLQRSPIAVQLLRSHSWICRSHRWASHLSAGRGISHFRRTYSPESAIQSMDAYDSLYFLHRVAS